MLPVNFGFGFLLGAKSQQGKIQNLGPYYLPTVALVAKVDDGDTIEVTSPIYKIPQGFDKVSFRSVRLLGINTPDKGSANYQEAKTTLERLVAGKQVNLEYEANQNDKYGRLLAWIWLDGKLINQEMLNSGFAVKLEEDNQKLKYNLTE